MTWRKIVPNLFTLGALVCAMISIFKSIDGEFLQASQFIMLCLILDGLDGNVARLFKGQTKFGAELDTFVDITGYGIAPAIMAHQAVMKDFGLWGMAFVCLTVIAGSLRLSRFRVADPFRGQRGYCGLPITVNASWIAAFMFITHSGLLNEEHITLSSGPMATLVWTCSLIFLFLQVSNVRYGKPSKTPVMFVGGVVMVMLLFMKLAVGVASAFAILAYLFFYAVISPFLPKHEDVLDSVTSEDEEEQPATLRHL
jgi:CDP-diacylglycerol--serine O-phosphatidyltransferase